MTPHQREIIRHALGLSRGALPYRNLRFEPSALSGGDYIYIVTTKGVEAVASDEHEPSGDRDA